MDRLDSQGKSQIVKRRFLKTDGPTEATAAPPTDHRRYRRGRRRPMNKERFQRQDTESMLHYSSMQATAESVAVNPQEICPGHAKGPAWGTPALPRGRLPGDGRPSKDPRPHRPERGRAGGIAVPSTSRGRLSAGRRSAVSGNNRWRGGHGRGSSPRPACRDAVRRWAGPSAPPHPC